MNDEEQRDVTRRHALKLGAAGLAGTGLGLGALTWTFSSTPGGAQVANLSPPPPQQVIQSSNGLLQGTLTVTGNPAWLSGDPTIGTVTYNGVFPGPILRAKPGDRVLLDVTNNYTQMINTHFHGLHVTPEGFGDNVFAMVDPGQTFHHDFVIPADHPGGLNWYHPHMHGFVDGQLYAGLAGLFIIEGGARAIPGLDTATEVIMALHNTAISVGPPQTLLAEPAGAAQQQVINGQLMPAYTIAPGETQLWRIGNTGNDPYYQLALDGHTFTVLAEDGILLWQTYDTAELFMPPGKRYEVAVTGSATPGPYTFRQLGHVQGPFGTWPAADLATLTVVGPVQTPVAIPANPRARDDLLNAPIAAHRIITMSEGFKAPSTALFFMNGVLFENITAADIVQVTLGTVEEWVIRNDPSLAAGGAAEQHPFHIHINPFVVIGRGTWDPATGQPTSLVPIDPKGTADTINVDPGEYVVVRMRFADFVGKSVFHCHITYHEDHGMMGQFQVNAPPPVPTTPTTTAPATSPAAAVSGSPNYSG